MGTDFLSLQLTTGVCFVLASGLNLLLVYLIATATPRELWNYSRILILTCVTDIAMAVNAFAIDPVSFQANPRPLPTHWVHSDNLR